MPEITQWFDRCPHCSESMMFDSDGRYYCDCWDDDDDWGWFDEEHVSQDIQEQIPQFPEYDSEI
jgi:hypothetical protein